MHVFQKGFTPPCFMIFPTFEGLRKTSSDLELPTDSDQIFYSKFIAGGDYTRTLGRAREQHQEFTVEQFGLLTPLNSFPDSRQYATSPKYLYESATEVFQVWRIRVFWSAASFTPSLTNPITPHRPGFPYLEEVWHPTRPKKSISLGGLDNFSVGFSLLNHFYNKTREILTEKSATVGRPRGSGFYESTEEFYQEAKKVYREIAIRQGRPAQQKEVAYKMNLKLKTFRKYWTRVGHPWHWLYEILMTPPVNPRSQSNR